MKQKMQLLLFVLFFGLIFLFLGILSNSTIKTKMPSANSETVTTSQLLDNTLLSKIKSYANEHTIYPIDAKIDRIWKAIPGYNGLSIDIENSFEKMLSIQEFKKDLMVYKEVPPQVHLNDLPPSPIYKGNPEKPMVSLLINVAWGNEFIPQILSTLNERQVKATFFFDGSWVTKNPDFAKRIHKDNHEIGSHAYSHPNLELSSKEETRIELVKTNDVIEKTLGFRPKWFAPPSGSFNQETINIARELDMLTVLWTIDTVDWKKPATSEMVNRVLSQVGNGSMILMHPTKPVSEGLETMILDIEEKGYVLGTVSELMSEKRIHKPA